MNAVWPRRTPLEEREYRRRHLAAALRIFARLGFDEGAGGHLTARDPLMPGCFWVNAFGQPFAHVRASDVLLVNAEGQVLEGEGRINPAAYAIHAQVHAARPDVVAAAHTHSVHGRAWSSLGRQLDPISQDACAFFEDHALHADFSGVVLDAEEGKRIAASLGGAKAVILANHGLMTVGGSVAEACWWFVAMERSCQAQLLAEAAGTPRLITDDDARRTRDLMGSPALGRLNFRPLYEQVVRAQPELLD